MVDKKELTLKDVQENKQKNIVIEFLMFLSHNKKWWLLPIIIILLLFGSLLMLGTSAIAPFIYPLF